ncbi:hypothetical protein PVAP13_2KG429000 [Panicum virgatum]|uniref:Uncharacterized protein n=1 Tax=Panicum virgatum TaxID=38727 RepID=A0A8T0WHB2_PANVG|nr:hypothetical protein PVAP13_2KG429000 [Panicum virgatum]
MRMLRWFCGHTRRDRVRNEAKGHFFRSSSARRRPPSSHRLRFLAVRSPFLIAQRWQTLRCTLSGVTALPLLILRLRRLPCAPFSLRLPHNVPSSPSAWPSPPPTIRTLQAHPSAIPAFSSASTPRSRSPPRGRLRTPPPPQRSCLERLPQLQRLPQLRLRRAVSGRRRCHLYACVWCTSPNSSASPMVRRYPAD